MISQRDCEISGSSNTLTARSNGRAAITFAAASAGRSRSATAMSSARICDSASVSSAASPCRRYNSSGGCVGISRARVWFARVASGFASQNRCRDWFIAQASAGGGPLRTRARLGRARLKTSPSSRRLVFNARRSLGSLAMGASNPPPPRQCLSARASFVRRWAAGKSSTQTTAAPSCQFARANGASCHPTSRRATISKRPVAENSQPNDYLTSCRSTYGRIPPCL